MSALRYGIISMLKQRLMAAEIMQKHVYINNTGKPDLIASLSLVEELGPFEELLRRI